MERAQIATAILVVGLAAGAGFWYSRSSPEPPPIAVAAAGEERGTVTVHVSGAVVSPGLYEVGEGSRVADAIAVAGGAAPGAGLSGLNLAAPVADGQQLIVPDAAAASPGAGVSAVGRVRVNSADVGALESLPGVGPVLAQRIKEHRDAFGPFGAVEDLLDVPGIGEGKLAAMRDAVQVP